MPIGSKFDDFLKEEGIFEITTAIAIKKVLAFQIEQEMQAQRLTTTQRKLNEALKAGDSLAQFLAR
jgi:hypothetical protein